MKSQLQEEAIRAMRQYFLAELCKERDPKTWLDARDQVITLLDGLTEMEDSHADHD